MAFFLTFSITSQGFFVLEKEEKKKLLSCCYKLFKFDPSFLILSLKLFHFLISCYFNFFPPACRFPSSRVFLHFSSPFLITSSPPPFFPTSPLQPFILLPSSFILQAPTPSTDPSIHNSFSNHRSIFFIFCPFHLNESSLPLPSFPPPSLCFLLLWFREEIGFKTFLFFPLSFFHFFFHLITSQCPSSILSRYSISGKWNSR